MKKSTFWMSALATFCFMTVSLFAQEELESPPRDQGAWQMFIVLGMGFLFFYFILWRPEQKRRKAMDEQRNAIKKGDKVTAMGIIGTVSKINENTVIVRMFDGAKVEFLKAAITDVRPGTEEDNQKADE